MSTMINVKTLRLEMGRIVERVGKGEDFMVLYRSRPAFRIVPVTDAYSREGNRDGFLLGADAVGRSLDAPSASGHDRVLYSFR